MLWVKLLRSSLFGVGTGLEKFAQGAHSNACQTFMGACTMLCSNHCCTTVVCFFLAHGFQLAHRGYLTLLKLH